jgi:tight adherence protein B
MISPIFVLVIGGGLALLLLLVGIVVSLSSDREYSVDERIDRYTAGTAAEQVDPSSRTLVLTDWMNRRMERTSAGERISRELSRADLRLKPGEYIAVMVMASVATAAIAWFVGSRSILLGFVGAVFGLYLPRIYVKRQQSKRLIKFNEQLADMLNLMVNGLRAGYSTMQAMEAVSKELPAPICDEFRRVVQEMQLGVTMERALDNMLNRIPSDDLDMVITAINVQREVGGNLAEILDTISYTIRERVRIKGEIRVLTASVMYSGRFLAMLPIIVMLLLYVINRPYIMEFFSAQNVPCGYIALGVAGLLIGMGYMAMNKLADVEV